MSSWQTPKTNWGQPGQTVPGVDDFNRIERNINTLGRYDRSPGYGVASGVNTKTVNLDPAPEGYYEGMCFAFRNVAENTGAVTINVNGMGAKPLKKPNGKDVTAGFLKADSIYTVRFNGTNFILQGSDSAGNATPEHVLAGKTFSNDTDTGLTGTMPNNGNQSATLTITGSGKPTKTIPAGYTTGGTITAQLDPSLASVIKNAVTVGGVQGKYKGEFAYGYGTLSKGSTSIYKSGLGFRPTFARIELSRWVDEPSLSYKIYVYGYSYVSRMVMENTRNDPPSYSLVTVDTRLYSNSFEFSGFPSTIYNYEWDYEWWAYGGG